MKKRGAEAAFVGLSLLASFLALAAWGGEAQVGSTGASFLKLGSGARPEALGEAYGALADDASGIDFNPAGMSQMLEGEIEATHTQWFQGLRYENLNGVLSLGSGGMLGATFNFLSYPSITRTEQVANYSDPEELSLNYTEDGTFSPYDMQLALAYSRPVLPGLELGANAKLLSENIDSNDGYGLGLDLGGLLQTPLQGLDIGLVVQNLGAPIRVKYGSYALPRDFRVAASYRTLGESLLLLLETDLPSDNAEAFAAGLEYKLGENFYPRLGYRWDGLFNPWSLGLGIQFGQASFDVAVVPYGDLGLTYRASIAYRFGTPSAELSSKLPYISTKEGSKPLVLEPKASAPDKIQAWAIYIYDGSREPKLLKQFSGKGLFENEILWDGKLGDGSFAPEGFYEAVLSIRYRTGRVINSPYLRLQLDNASPEPALGLDGESVNPQAKSEAFVPAVFRPSIKGARLASSWRLEILDSQGRIFRTFKGLAEPPQALVWDGMNDEGQAMISGEIYQARLLALDPMGNEAASTKAMSFRAVFR